MTPLRIFIGYDPRQPLAYTVLAHSIATRSTKPVSITRLQLNQLPVTRTGLTEFTYSRFLTPYLSGFEGYSIFLDSDELCLGDITDLVATCLLEQIAAREPATLWVSKNKLRFEWASVMVFNNEECRVLTPEFISDPANSLFDMAWAKRVGEFPGEWNYLVGYDAPHDLGCRSMGTMQGAEEGCSCTFEPKLIHYTQGIPCWAETKGCEFAQVWRDEVKETYKTVSFEELMGRSVHATPVRERLAGERRPQS